MQNITSDSAPANNEALIRRVESFLADWKDYAACFEDLPPATEALLRSISQLVQRVIRVIRDGQVDDEPEEDSGLYI